MVCFKKNGIDLVAYTDSDYARNIDDRKSTSGHAFMLNLGAISWTSKKKQIVTLSTTEVEFVAAALSSCKALWLRKMSEVLGEEPKGPIIIYCVTCQPLNCPRIQSCMEGVNICSFSFPKRSL